jgi:hypothetical protein
MVTSSLGELDLISWERKWAYVGGYLQEGWYVHFSVWFPDEVLDVLLLHGHLPGELLPASIEEFVGEGN